MVSNTNKIKRIVGSTLEAKCFALIDGTKKDANLSRGGDLRSEGEGHSCKTLGVKQRH